MAGLPAPGYDGTTLPTRTPMASADRVAAYARSSGASAQAADRDWPMAKIRTQAVPENTKEQQMSTEHAFYVYRVVNADGETKHSSILYDDGASEGRTPDEVRESLLTAAVYAMGESELPDYDETPDPDIRFDLLGPYFLGAPIDSLTHAELTEIPEEQRP